MKKTKIAVVGVGHLGAIHTKVYSTLKNVELVGVCDISPEKLSEFTARYNVEGFTNVNQMLDRVDAVSIAVPTIHHYETAKPFLEKGIAVLLEKPMTATLQEAKEILNIAKKNNAILQIGHIERFNPAIQSIRRLTSDPRFIECHRLAPYKPRGTDVSVVLDLMIHDLDIVLTFIDSKIKRIDAVGTPVLSKQEDIANVRIAFENKAVANLTSSRISFQSMRKIRIFQHNGYISIDYVEQSAILYKKVKNRIQQFGIPIQKEQPLQKEIVSFVNCVRNKTQPIVSGEQGFRALQTAFEIIRKIRNG